MTEARDGAPSKYHGLMLKGIAHLEELERSGRIVENQGYQEMTGKKNLEIKIFENCEVCKKI